MEASKKMQEYFEEITQKTRQAHAIADEARKQGYDPEERVDIPLAKDMAERVEGLISAAAPQLVGGGMIERIKELEEKYGRLSWEVALKIALEVAQQKFCKFKDQKEAMEVGIRAGFTYHTAGIVSAPLEGIVEIKLKKRRDGKEYLALIYASPIRGAGGTACAVSLLIADHVRKNFGFESYDADEKEVSRYAMELQDYHERVTNLQYRPSDEEVKFLAAHIPVEIDGEPTEKLEVSNYKNLDRIETNKIRGGVCLVMSMLALKAPKLWKETKKWEKDFGMEHWTEFLEKFLEVQKKQKAKTERKEETTKQKKITPDYTFIADLVAGRPVLSHPLAKGGFRLRYGRSRLSGFSAASIHPATAQILDKFIATGTQLKTERPGKAAAISMCSTIEGPIVKLNSGDVVKIENESEAKQLNPEVEEVLFLGDILFCYGDFLDRAHVLVPPGYCEEWWIQELEKATANLFGSIDREKFSELTEITIERAQQILANPNFKIHFAEAKAISDNLKIPMHPRFSYHWNELSKEEILNLIDYLDSAKVEKSSEVEKIILPMKKEKRLLELIGIPHKVSTEYVVLLGDDAAALLCSLGITNPVDIVAVKHKLEQTEFENGVEAVNSISKFKIRDKSGIFIGARMGRPEKAKMRKLTGSPHSLFPCGKEGGRLRSFQSALENRTIDAEFPIYYCENCKKNTVLKVCHQCDKKAKRLSNCKICKSDEQCTHNPQKYAKQKIPIKEYIDGAMKLMGESHFPDLIKGVRGTSNKDHIPEHITKGILRAKHQICVNKDGTTRYDMTEIPITHFKPKEIGTSIELLKKLGYEKDIRGKELESDEQILEIKPQDVILPASPDSPDEKASDVLLRIASFVDNLLTGLYRIEPFYNATKKDDLIGHLVIGLAPHISAGIVGRIIGFSETQTCLGHPLWHAAHRRDCDGDENCVILLMDALLNFSRQYLPDRRGGRTMDAPLVLTYILNPSEVDDMVHKMDVASRYPLEFYEACLEYKHAWEIKIDKIGDRLGTEKQYEQMGFTHDTDDFNGGARCSAYKILPTMEEKIKGQMKIAGKVRAVDQEDVARLVIEKHLIKDVRGNLRKFSMQKFRCSTCNESFRRPPLSGICLKCGGKIIFTISEGSIVKYLEPSILLAKKYTKSDYLAQVLDLTRRRIESVFGKQKEKQTGIKEWFA